jgi:ribosomal protein L40E
MKCPRCQFENPEDSKFCLKCGSKVEKICPKCGKLLPSIAEFCNECDQNLKERKESPGIDYEKPKSYTPKHRKFRNSKMVLWVHA